MSEPAETQQADVDARNADFWQELCGSSWARMLGIEAADEEGLARFDAFYFDYYPYLKGYVDRVGVAGKRVLEIGLGYGSLGAYIAAQGAEYHGVDISPNPVEMMRHRLRLLGLPGGERVVVGSALDLPFPDASLDAVFAIGCLHHTGDLPRSIGEVHRVLVPGGTAVVMVYNRYSARQLHRVDRLRLQALLHRQRPPSAEQIRADYDTNEAGEAAPHTDFTSRRQAKRLFHAFSSVRIDGQNLDDVYRHGRLLARRDRLLATPAARLLGLDLYVTARK